MRQTLSGEKPLIPGIAFWISAGNRSTTLVPPSFAYLPLDDSSAHVPELTVNYPETAIRERV